MEPQHEQKLEPVEAAARKVNVDEDYDNNNNSEDEKRTMAAVASASVPTSAVVEAPKDSPTNGTTPLVPKQEAIAT